MHLIIGFISSYLSAVGFAMFFSCPKRSIALSSLAGAIGFWIYMIVGDFVEGLFLPAIEGAYYKGISVEVF